MKKILVFLVVILAAVGCGNTQVKPTQVKPTQVKDDTVYLYFIRHGKTLFNTTDQVQGWSDTPLTAAGMKGAEQVANALSKTDFTLAYSSDLGRARKTAQVILAANKVNKPALVEMEGLREVFYGSYEGKTNYEIMKPLFDAKGIAVTPQNWGDKYEELMKVASEEWMINQYHANDPTHTAETYKQVITRTKESIDAIMKEAKKTGGNVLIVTHGEQIALSLSYIFGRPNDSYIGNSSITVVAYKDGKYSLVKINDTSHIK